MKKGKNKKRFKLAKVKIGYSKDVKNIKKELEHRYKDIDVERKIDN